jgi:hypothetical protein
MNTRRQKASIVRKNAADLAYERHHPRHIANGDEQRIPRHAANYTKGLPHDHHDGLLLEISGDDIFQRFVKGIDSGNPRDFMDTPLGPHEKTVIPATSSSECAECAAQAEKLCEDSTPEGDRNWKSEIARTGACDRPVKVRAWESAGAGNTFDLEGPDAQAVTMPPAPKVGSHEFTAEVGEVYCQALLRDVPFSFFRFAGKIKPPGKGKHDEILKKEIDKKMAALNKLPWFCGADVGRLSSEAERRRRIDLNLQTVFRGIAPGDDIGPYVSQFMLMGNSSLERKCTNTLVERPENGYIRYGAIRADQRVRKVVEIDFMASWDEWFDVQNGADVRGLENYEADKSKAYRFITTPRDMATYVHHDALYEAYLNACLILLGMGMPFDPGIPFQRSDDIDHQQGFAHFGGPHILSLVTEVATRALKAVRFQKFNVHRRLRPEAIGGRLQKADKLGMPEFEAMRYELDEILTEVQAHNANTDKVLTPATDSVLLPMAFPEGSPMHPTYGAGHATVAGACVTILKAYFDQGQELKVGGQSGKAYVPDATGQSLNLVDVYDRHYEPATLTVEGELNKLAANISIGRDWAGVHYFTDYWESLLMGEQIAIGILEEQKLTYGENFSMMVPLFAGGTIRI